MITHALVVQEAVEGHVEVALGREQAAHERAVRPHRQPLPDNTPVSAQLNLHPLLKLQPWHSWPADPASSNWHSLMQGFLPSMHQLDDRSGTAAAGAVPGSPARRATPAAPCAPAPPGAVPCRLLSACPAARPTHVADSPLLTILCQGALTSGVLMPKQLLLCQKSTCSADHE